MAPNGPIGGVTRSGGPAEIPFRSENRRPTGSNTPIVSRPSPSQSPTSGRGAPPEREGDLPLAGHDHVSGARSVHQLVCWVAPATENEKCTWVSWGSLVLVYGTQRASSLETR